MEHKNVLKYSMKQAIINLRQENRTISMINQMRIIQKMRIKCDIRNKIIYKS